MGGPGEFMTNRRPPPVTGRPVAEVMVVDGNVGVTSDDLKVAESRGCGA